MDRTAELEYMICFIRESYLDEEIARDHLRALWTAHCLHHNLAVDTLEYDKDLSRLWDEVSEDGGGTSDWSDRDSFDNFLCRLLV